MNAIAAQRNAHPAAESTELTHAKGSSRPRQDFPIGRGSLSKRRQLIERALLQLGHLCAVGGRLRLVAVGQVFDVRTMLLVDAGLNGRRRGAKAEKRVAFAGAKQALEVDVTRRVRTECVALHVAGRSL